MYDIHLSKQHFPKTMFDLKVVVWSADDISQSLCLFSGLTVHDQSKQAQICSLHLIESPLDSVGRTVSSAYLVFLIFCFFPKITSEQMMKRTDGGENPLRSSLNDIDNSVTWSLIHVSVNVFFYSFLPIVFLIRNVFFSFASACKKNIFRLIWSVELLFFLLLCHLSNNIFHCLVWSHFRRLGLGFCEILQICFPSCLHLQSWEDSTVIHSGRSSKPFCR